MTSSAIVLQKILDQMMYSVHTSYINIICNTQYAIHSEIIPNTLSYQKYNITNIQNGSVFCTEPFQNCGRLHLLFWLPAPKLCKLPNLGVDENWARCWFCSVLLRKTTLFHQRAQFKIFSQVYFCILLRKALLDARRGKWVCNFTPLPY